VIRTAHPVIRNFFRVVLVLWTGSLWSVGLWVTPILFSMQSDHSLAGVLAGRIFSIETYVGIAVAVLALLLPGRTKFVWGYFAAGLLAVNEWALRPVMVVARAHGSAVGLTFGAWHGVSAVVYLAACLALLVLVWKQDFRG
jgi:Domain of unknown function (DUF4149)